MSDVYGTPLQRVCLVLRPSSVASLKRRRLLIQPSRGVRRPPIMDESTISQSKLYFSYARQSRPVRSGLPVAKAMLLRLRGRGMQRAGNSPLDVSG